jgi:hypothetical protein
VDLVIVQGLCYVATVGRVSDRHRVMVTFAASVYKRSDA